MTAMVWCPFPSKDVARTIAASLLDEKLIGCANILGDMESMFEWDGERGEAQETGVLFKCDARLLDKVVDRLGALHPYDTPAILGWRCDAAPQAVQAWLANTAGNNGAGNNDFTGG